jgi:hypothetical protein
VALTILKMLMMIGSSFYRRKTQQAAVVLVASATCRKIGLQTQQLQQKVLLIPAHQPLPPLLSPAAAAPSTAVAAALAGSSYNVQPLLRNSCGSYRRLYGRNLQLKQLRMCYRGALGL